MQSYSLFAGYGTGTAVRTASYAGTNEPPHLLLWLESLAHGADGDEEVE